MKGPQRLSETSHGRLGESLDGLRARLPDAERLARIAGGLSQQGVPVAVSPTPPAHPLEPVSSSLHKPLLFGVGAAIGIAVAALLLRPSDVPGRSTPLPPSDGATVVRGDGDARTRSGSTSPSVANAPARKRELPLTSASGSAEPREDQPVDALPVVERAAKAEERTSTPGTTQRAPSTGRALPSMDISAGDGRPAKPSEPARTRAAGAESPDEARGPRSASLVGPDSEITLLQSARRALSTAPAEALALTELHRAEYPRGKLVQERELLAVTALVRLGRTKAAHQRADRFRKTYPRSAYLHQLERVIGTR